MKVANRNILYTKIFVDELARNGLEHVCIAPGSRNTPLVIAFHENQHIQVHSLIDERSAAFFALGIGLETDKPAALVCSSGTAGANFYPAIIEARYAAVPMLVLTADRPHELRHSGANQTIDQVNMFGDHVLWSVDMGLPEATPPDVALRNLRTTAARAYHTALGTLDSRTQGAVHINFPFRKPLEPTSVESDQTTYDAPDKPLIIQSGDLKLSDPQILQLTQLITASKRGLIICGPRCKGEDFPSAILRLSRATGFPILADPLSGVRYTSPDMEQPASAIISTYDTFIRSASAWGAPDIVLHFGASPTSQALLDYLNATVPMTRISISSDGIWRDPDHRTTHFIHSDPSDAANRLASEIKTTTMIIDVTWVNRFHIADKHLRESLIAELNTSMFDGSAIARVMAQLPENTRILVGNSLPIRHVDQFGLSRDINLHVYGNRGASGIDGNVSTALGIAVTHPEHPTVLIIGDLAFYHDLNGLLAIKRDKITNITIVLINNDGGGIFNRLPIANFEPPFTDLFLTPHGLEFENAAKMYGLTYTEASTLDALSDALKNARTSQRANLIEVLTDNQHDHARRLEINKSVMEDLSNVLNELN